MSTEIKSIIEILQKELTLQKRHIELLQTQHGALISCDRAAFAAAQKDYVRLLAEVKRHAAQRSLALGGNTPPLKERIAAWPQRERAQGEALLVAIFTLIGRIKLVSLQNAAMIQNELRYGKFMLDLYIDAARKQSNYAKRGMQPMKSVTLLINHVA